MIEVKNVTKKYGSFVAVDDISFKIKEGEIVGFLGANGAGKSTTMNMITGYIEATNGQILINGVDNVKHPRKTKKMIGYMPESTPLYFDLTVKEFIGYMADLKNVKRKDRKEQIEKVIKETGLNDVQNKIIKNLSRGYKQRVSLAGALVGEPEIIILDEPTVGLDPKQITEIRSLIKSLGKKHTVILSSHILSEVSQVCEKVIIINKGKIVAVDSPENLEEMVKEENSVIITVEDDEDKMKDITKLVKEVTKVELQKENEDGSKTYIVTAEDKIDLRKKLFAELPKNDVTILELKKQEVTLEDAFIKLINKETEKAEAEEKNKKNKKTEESKEEKNKKDNKTQENKSEANSEKDSKEENNKEDNKEEDKKTVNEKKDNKEETKKQEDNKEENKKEENKEENKNPNNKNQGNKKKNKNKKNKGKKGGKEE